MKISPKELIDDICELERTTPRELLNELEKTYKKGYTLTDYINNNKLPRRMKVDLERRWYTDNVKGIEIVNKMKRKGQRFAFILFKWVIIVGGIIYLSQQFL